MSKTSKKILLSATVFVFIFVPILAANAINLVNPGNAFSDADFNEILENVAVFITGFIAILAIIFLVYGGLLYVTAGGDDNQMEKAKTTITYAIFGLFIAALAYAIIVLIVNTIING